MGAEKREEEGADGGAGHEGGEDQTERQGLRGGEGEEWRPEEDEEVHGPFEDAGCEAEGEDLGGG